MDGQKYFNYGQIYVAISQYKILEGIHMLGEIEKKNMSEQIGRCCSQTSDCEED